MANSFLMVLTHRHLMRLHLMVCLFFHYHPFKGEVSYYQKQWFQFSFTFKHFRKGCCKKSFCILTKTIYLYSTFIMIWIVYYMVKYMYLYFANFSPYIDYFIYLAVGITNISTNLTNQNILWKQPMGLISCGYFDFIID